MCIVMMWERWAQAKRVGTGEGMNEVVCPGVLM